MSKEIWKDVVGYEGLYTVSNLGRVKSLNRKVYDKNGELHYTQKEMIRKSVIGNNGYFGITLCKNGKHYRVHIHRLIAKHFINDFNETLSVDHIDGDRTNNNIANLRMCHHKDNMCNIKNRKDTKSIFKGVSYMENRNKKYYSYIWKDGIRHNLGYFYTDIEAALAYDKKAIELHGEYARTNAMLGLIPHISINQRNMIQ